TTCTNDVPKRIVFEYDYLGRRIAKKVWNNTAGTGNPATYLKYLYDGWILIAELNGNSGNSLVRAYTWGLDASGSMQGVGGVGGLLMVNAGSGGVHFPAYDLNGNVMGLVNATNGMISAKYEYGPFGEVFCSVGDMAKVNPFQFSTKYTDNETDLVYYGYRYYSPALGRWLSRDPIEEQGGLNLYGFVNNDPVNKWDKLGLRGIGCGYGVMGSDTEGIISDTPIQSEPPGPGLWDQYNPDPEAGRGWVDYREWFEYRFPRSIQSSKNLLKIQIVEKACSSPERHSILSELKGVHINPDHGIEGNYYDKKQTYCERHFYIGEFWVKANNISLNWENACCFSYKATAYVEEQTGADDPKSPNYKTIPDWLWHTRLFYKRIVTMAEWQIEGKGCCKR
ncbi:MAG: RHS repeat-associated core domain-containing protein, partial [Parabacteroides sp.]|nr:RHS repeat-associated core domain-containing protein [Parabacteroides sp.]